MRQLRVTTPEVEKAREEYKVALARFRTTMEEVVEKGCAMYEAEIAAEAARHGVSI